MREKIQAYQPAAAAFLVMMAMSLTSSTMSFFLVPVCEALRISRGSFSAVFSLMTISGALTNPFLGQYAGKKGARNILLISGIWVCVGMLLFASASQLWMLYLAAFCMGAFGTTCVSLCANVIVQQAYLGAQASAILGTVMAGSGVGGMIFSLIIPAILNTYGWQQGIRAMGISWLALLWLAALLLGKQAPSLPGSKAQSVGLGMTRSEALRSPKLYLQMLVIMIITACCGFQQQQPSLLSAYGFSSGQVSMLISMQTAFLAAGKVLQGLLYGKMGIRKGGSLMLVVFAAGFATMASSRLVYPGLILIALGFGVYTTLLPLVARRVFGSREYAAIWALIATAGSAGTFIANPVLGRHIRRLRLLHPRSDRRPCAAAYCPDRPEQNPERRTMMTEKSWKATAFQLFVRFISWTENTYLRRTCSAGRIPHCPPWRNAARRGYSCRGDAGQ